MQERKYVAKDIRLSDRFHTLVVDGKKRSTIRLGLVFFNDNIISLKFGRSELLAKILKIDYSKSFADLNEEDAIKDGFLNLQTLHAELLHFYPAISGADQVTIVHFQLV